MTTVLIVEDEAIVAADLAKILRRLGYEISGLAARGEEAVALARDRHPDVVLMDIRLAGGMDGIEAAEQIRRLFDLPVVYLTAHSDRATLQRAKLTEPFGYILKPFEERELETHIEMALYKHQTEQKLRASEERLQQFNAVLEQRVREQTAQLRALAAELTQAEERERRRITKILHDDLQQLLVAARMYLTPASGKSDEKSLTQGLQRANQLLDESIRISRELSHELSPPILHDAELPEALKWLGTWMHKKHRLSVQLDAPAQNEPLPEDLRLLLFDSTRELLFNIVKHAGVKRACVKLATTNGPQVELLVSDEGKGFDVQRITVCRAPGDGFGLFRIRERLGWIGGRMEIESAPKRGSQIRLIAPFSPMREGKTGTVNGVLPSVTPSPAEQRRRARACPPG
jgi:signal transduction histidine kinase